MSSKLMMANNHKNVERNSVDSVRVRVPPQLKASPPPPLPLPSSLAKCCKPLNGVNDCSTQLLIDNVSNFKRSGAPARFMYYEDGSWNDFSGETFRAIRSGFLEAKPMVEVQIGNSLYLFDFYRMLLIDFESGNQRSIAWLDVDGKCFFPKRFIEGGGGFSDVPAQNPAIEISNATEGSSSEFPKIEIQIRIGEYQNSTKRKREGVESEFKGEEREDQTEGSSSNDQVQRSKKRQQLIVPVLQSPWLPNTKLLKEGDKAYSVIKNLFLSSLEVSERGAMVTTIHQCVRTDPLDKARYQVFQKQLEITKAARGDANMTFAWHGTSAEGVASILAHGFGMPSKISGRAAHGIGIYLSPIKSSHLSAMLSEIDENGEKHVILCRVILGRYEKVEAGSQQLYPSSVDFDTGVDDVNNPKWHVVWCANMNTLIIPECVVSYKASNHLSGRLNKSSSLFKLMPNPPTIFSTQLLSKLGNSLPPSKALQLQNLCSTYKDRKVLKDAFMTQLRSIVGDDRLLSTIRELHPLD